MEIIMTIYSTTRLLRGSVCAALVILSAADAAYAQSPACSFPIAYPGDLAPREAIAAWMAARASAAGLPDELPVMAALVESGLQNVANGSADSVGFFQMRVDIWSQGAYFGYPNQPELQVKWFLDQAIAVRNAAIAHSHRGLERADVLAGGSTPRSGHRNRIARGIKANCPRRGR